MRRASAALLLLLLSMPAPPLEADPGNLLVNPGFEAGLDGWTVSRSGWGDVRPDPIAHDGAGSALLSVVRVGDEARVSQVVRVARGRRYCIEGWTQALGPGGGGFRVTVATWGAVPVELGLGGAAWEWTWQRACWTADRSPVVVTVSAVVGLHGGGGYLDSLALVPQ